MTPGQSVRIVNPDREAHATGTVVESQGNLWPVWVRHFCDCWTAGTRALHVRGYTESEVMVPNVVGTQRDLWDNGGSKTAPGVASTNTEGLAPTPHYRKEA